jgi:hypothetical protein
VHAVASVVPAVAAHRIASVDPAAAEALSRLLGHAVTPGTAATYLNAFSQLQVFCSARGLPFLPTDSISLCAWLAFKADSGVKAKSLGKYVSGVRYAHLLYLGVWHLVDDALVALTLRGASARNPSANKRQKVPLSFDTILLMCQVMPGWPVLANLSFDDLTWATASSVAFFGALRGGEFFVRQGSYRPLLFRSMISVSRPPHRLFLRVKVPASKTGSGLAFAMDPGPACLLGPVALWDEYDSRRMLLPFNTPSSQDLPAFQMSSGQPLTGSFMLGHANALATRAGIRILDSDANVVSIGSASWRAGYVLSARNADVSDSTISANGRWSTTAGPRPYSFDSTRSLGEAALAINNQAIQGGTIASFAGGRYLSENVFQRGLV